jgi:hypothetical protein
MIFAATYISILIGIGSLAWGYAQLGFDPLVRWLLFFGAAWLFARWRRWWWFSTLGLILAVLIAALGMWLGIPPGWMVASAIFALIAWHMTDFRQRTRFEKANEELRELEYRRIGRLTLLTVVGLLLSSIPMLMRDQFTLEWGGLVLTVLLLGFVQLLRRTA